MMEMADPQLPEPMIQTFSMGALTKSEFAEVWRHMVKSKMK
jgi:hypothetical protein